MNPSKIISSMLRAAVVLSPVCCWSVAASPPSRREQLNVAFLSNTMRRWSPNNIISAVRRRGEKTLPQQQQQNSIVLQYSTDGNQNKIIAKEKNNESDELLLLLPVYQTVAEQDPLWYDKFVMNVLGKSLAKEIGLPIIAAAPTTHQTLRPGDKATTATTSGNEMRPPTRPKPSSSSNDGGVEIESSSSIPIAAEKESPEFDTTSTVVTDTSTSETLSEISTNEVEGKVDQSIIVDSQTAMATQTDVSNNNNNISTSGSATDKNNINNDEEEEEVLLYEDPESRCVEMVPLLNMTLLGYSKEDILLLQPDYLSMIIHGKVRRPRAGIPPNWQTIKSSSAVNNNINNIISSRAEAEKIIITKNNKNEPTKKAPANAVIHDESMTKSANNDAGLESAADDPKGILEEATIPSSKTAPPKVQDPSDGNAAASSTNTTTTTTTTTQMSTVKKAVELLQEAMTTKQQGISQMATKNEPTSTTSSSSLQSPANKATSSASSFSDSKEDDYLVVVYNQDSSSSSGGKLRKKVPLSNLTSLGYNQAEIVLLQSDFLDVIVADKIERPRSGVPPSWQKPKPVTTARDGTTTTTTTMDVEIVTPSEFEKMRVVKESSDVVGSRQQEATSSSTKSLGTTPSRRDVGTANSAASTVPRAKDSQSSVFDDEKTIDTSSSDDDGKLPENVVPAARASNIKSSGMLSNKERLSVDGEAGNWEGGSLSSSDVPTRETKTNTRVGSSKPASAEDPELGNPLKPSSDTKAGSDPTNPPSGDEVVVLYFDSARGEIQVAALSKLTSLGYTEADVSNLQAEVLATILENKTRKPRTGIPYEWRNSESNQGTIYQGNVKLLPRLDAEILAKTEAKKSARVRDANVYSNRNRRIQGPQTPLESVRSRENRERSREKRAYKPDGSKKSIYSVRAGNRASMDKKRRGDPPTPKFPLWIDIDTFRSLLRQEAEFRVRLLGGNFAAAIKDESDWRLELYKDWLWTLDKGIGSPIVPSRMERNRVPPPQSSQNGPDRKGRPQRRNKNRK